MWLLYFFCNWILDLILTPLKLSIELIIRLLWKPNVSFEYYYEPKTFGTNHYEKLLPYLNKILKEYDKVKDCGDSAKYIGCMAAGLYYIKTYFSDYLSPQIEEKVNKLYNEVKETLKQFIQKDKRTGEIYFVRNTYNLTGNDFSEDQFPGWLLGSYLVGNLKDDLWVQEKLIPALENSLKSKPYWMFHPKHDRIKYTDRGYIYRFWFLTCYYHYPLLVLSLLKKYHRSFYKRLLYSCLYWMTWILAILHISILPVGIFWYNKYMYYQMYTSHTNMINGVLQLLLGSKIIGWLTCKFIYKRAGWNPDIAGMYGIYIEHDKDKLRTIYKYIEKFMDYAYFRNFSEPEAVEYYQQKIKNLPTINNINVYLSMKWYNIKKKKFVYDTLYIRPIPAAVKLTHYGLEKSQFEPDISEHEYPMDYIHLFGCYACIMNKINTIQ